MSQENNSQQEEIESKESDNRYEGLLERMGINDADSSSTPSGTPSNSIFVNLIKRALHPLDAVVRKGQSL
jgi:hypothetical protein